MAFPARAGMARRRPPTNPEPKRVPRPRGDGPSKHKKGISWNMRSPPARGWPPARRAGGRPFARRSPPARGWPGDAGDETAAPAAFPARAGMARLPILRVIEARRVPRPRGDGPEKSPRNQAGWSRSPPARGWPDGLIEPATEVDAFPARAGMALNIRLPLEFVPVRSPPARGWPAGNRTRDRCGIAFPARAGMARTWASSRRPCRRVPRPRGDGP